MPLGEDYTRSRSRKQWTDRTEGILKNIIDKLWESTSVPSVLLNIPEPPPVGGSFVLSADQTIFNTVNGVGGILTTLVRATSIGNWAGTVSLSLSHTVGLCGPGGGASLSSASLTLDSAHPDAATVLTINVPSICPVGNYSARVAGAGDSLSDDVLITVVVGKPGVTPGTPCTSDADCTKLYGSGYYCADGECRKGCGGPLACNKDLCPPGQNCIWHAGKGVCLCYEPDFDLSCPAYIKIYKGFEMTNWGTISVTSRDGFAGTVTISTEDECNPECMKCVGYNVSPASLTLASGETKTATLTVYGHKCPSVRTYFLKITASGGGKTKSCVTMIVVDMQSTGGIGIIRWVTCSQITGIHTTFRDSNTDAVIAVHDFVISRDPVTGRYQSDCFPLPLEGLTAGFHWHPHEVWISGPYAGGYCSTIFYECGHDGSYNPPNWAACFGGSTLFEWCGTHGRYEDLHVSGCGPRHDPHSACTIEAGTCPDE